MNDFKSKLPDFKELTEMTTKLFNGIKNSVDEIIQDYKQKRADNEAHETAETPEPIVPPAESPESPPVEKPVTPPENPTV